MDNFPDWLTNEAISNYLVFFGGLLIGFVVWAIRKRYLDSKPAIVRVEKKSESSLIDLAPEARDRLNITFQDQPINQLHQATYTLTNQSDKPIKDVAIVFNFERPDPNEVLEIAHEDPLEGIRLSTVVEINLQNGQPEFNVKLSTPYLNPSKDYEDILVLSLYSPTPVSLTSVNGGGYGWGTKYFDKVAYNETLQRIISESSGIADLVVNLIGTRIVRW